MIENRDEEYKLSNEKNHIYHYVYLSDSEDEDY